MSRKEHIGSFRMANTLPMTGSEVVSSLIANVGFVDDIGLQINFSGSSPVGTFTLQTSVDYNPITNNPGNWVPILLTYWSGSAFVPSYTIPTSLGSPLFFDIDTTAVPVLQLVYTNISGGPGTFDAYLTGKGL